MPKLLTRILCVMLCAAAVFATAGLLRADGFRQKQPQSPQPLPAPISPTAEPTQPVILPTEPLPQEPQVEIAFGQMPEDAWAAYPDGIRIETIRKPNFLAHMMIIRDPSAVYLATSATRFSLNTLGGRLPTQMVKEGAIAAINAGAFNDDGSAGTHVGSLPFGMVISEGEILWDDGRSYYGFVGMTQDDRLIVSETIDRQTVEALGIRDGCCFGPVLIKDGVANYEQVHARSVADNINSRTAIGQLADGSVIFLCIDGRQCGSIGATYDDLLALMVEIGCVNACALDGGASTVMTYKDTYGRYGTAGEVITCSSYSLFQAAPRRMPTFFMVRPGEEG